MMLGLDSAEQPSSDSAVVCRETARPLEPAGRDERRRAAQRLIRVYAGLAAANSLNPVPGLDLGIDAGILTALHHAISNLYGLPTELAQPQACFLSMLQPITLRAAPTLTGNAVGAIFRRLGLECIGRETTKWLPLVGTAISATIGYQIVRRYGEQLLQECESAAGELPELVQLPEAA
jgi:uncharacterized protein (DUF697 family)